MENPAATKTGQSVQDSQPVFHVHSNQNHFIDPVEEYFIDPFCKHTQRKQFVKACGWVFARQCGVV